MSDEKPLSAPDATDLVDVDTVAGAPLLPLAQAWLTTYRQYADFATKFPEEAYGTAELFGRVLRAQTRLRIALEKLHLTGSLRGTSPFCADRMTAVRRLRDADAEITSLWARALGPEAIPIKDQAGTLRSYPALSCFAKGQPLRFAPSSIAKIELAVALLAQEPPESEPPNAPQGEPVDPLSPQPADAAPKELPAEVATIWYHGDKSYSTDGQTPALVSQEQHNLLQVFLDKNQARDTHALESAGVSNVGNVISKLAKHFGEGVIRRPKKRCAGYFLRVCTLQAK